VKVILGVKVTVGTRVSVGVRVIVCVVVGVPVDGLVVAVAAGTVAVAVAWPAGSVQAEANRQTSKIILQAFI
jgi:hypothetical protein